MTRRANTRANLYSVDMNDDQLMRADRRIAQLEAALSERTSLLVQAQTELNGLAASKPYKALKLLTRVMDRVLPIGSRRRNCVKWLAKVPRKLFRKKAAPAGSIFADRFDLVFIPEDEYRTWCEQHEPDAQELERQPSMRFASTPTISIVVPVYNPPGEFLVAMIDSVIQQTYPHWELCLADASPAAHVRPILERFAASDSRIRVKFLERNLGIVGNSNAAIELATGEFIGLLDHDDTLAVNALHAMATAINSNPEADFLYSDEDKLDPRGNRVLPYFKPGWSPDTLRTHNYVCHFTVLRRSMVERIGGFREGYDGSQDHDLILRAGEAARRVVHIPQMLYHWRMHANSTAANPESKTYAYEAGRRAVADHLARIGRQADVHHGETVGYFQPVYHLVRQSLVSVIIANRNSAKLLRDSVAAVQRSGYANWELLIVENGSTEPETFALYEELQADSRVRILHWEKPFNYASVNNFAASQANGEMLLFLNNDVRMVKSDWLEVLMRFGMQPGVGAVGAKLFYEDGSIQHAGIALGLGGVAGHLHLHYPGSAKGQMCRLLYTQNVSAVTGACLLTQREVFQLVGGFDEGFVLAYNDVDYCMKLSATGLSIIWTPHAELIHLESKTRGSDEPMEAKQRREAEAALFQRKWQVALQSGDPYFSLHFRRDRPDFALKLS